LRHDAPQPDSAQLTCALEGDFEAWLAGCGGALAISTYQAGKVALVGWDGARVSLLMRDFEKPLGLAVRGRQIALATRNELLLLADAPLLAADYLPEARGRYDALFLPRVAWFTGDQNIHDVAFTEAGLVYVNTRFSCLARPSQEYSFEPLWRPSFVSDLVPEDRCHLNGLALRDGRPKWVTALGATDTPGGWRLGKAAGGVLVDVDTGETLLGSLSMPHSPRWHDDRLWVLNSGAGELLAVDPQTGQAEVVCALPGYLRGLTFVGPFALVGLSRIRERHIFGGLPIQSRVERLRCGMAVVDTRDGRTVGMFEFTSGCEELYEVAFLPGLRRPMILNPQKPAIRDAFTSPEASYWLRPENLIEPTLAATLAPRTAPMKHAPGEAAPAAPMLQQPLRPT
jgi:uncharacterized protein (TIGR03032 family)